MSERESNDWDRRIVDFSKIHGSSSEAYQRLLDSVDLCEGQKIADIMCGYGEISINLLGESRRKKAGIDLYLLDSSKIQLGSFVENSGRYLNSSRITPILGDARTYRFDSSIFDIVIIKMGLHEVPFEDQRKVLTNMVDSLKGGGRLYVWESFGSTPKLNEHFNRIAHKKDELAGFHQMAGNRYFPNESEIVNLMGQTGLSQVHSIYSGDLPINPLYLVDLKRDPEKIKEFNSYVRNILPEDAKKALNFKDSEDEVQMTFTKKIFVGSKE